MDKIRQKKLLKKITEKNSSEKIVEKIRQKKPRWKKNSSAKNLSKNVVKKIHVTQKFLTNKFMGSLISSFSIFPHMLYCQWQLTSLKKILRDDCGQQCHTSYKHNIRLEKMRTHGIQHLFYFLHWKIEKNWNDLGRIFNIILLKGRIKMD